MSFFCPTLHAEAQHAPFFQYDTHSGPLCLACLLASLGDGAELDSRKLFVLRCGVRCAVWRLGVGYMAMALLRRTRQHPITTTP
jgi:hypothetical protein